jgi:hypothetical protein
VGCLNKDETEEELWSCSGLSEQNENNISFNLVYGKSVKDMLRAATFHCLYLTLLGFKYIYIYFGN